MKVASERKMWRNVHGDNYFYPDMHVDMQEQRLQPQEYEKVPPSKPSLFSRKFSLLSFILLLSLHLNRKAHNKKFKRLLPSVLDYAHHTLPLKQRRIFSALSFPARGVASRRKLFGLVDVLVMLPLPFISSFYFP